MYGNRTHRQISYATTLGPQIDDGVASILGNGRSSIDAAAKRGDIEQKKCKIRPERVVCGVWIS